MQEATNVLYIHGSGQSCLSWNFYSIFLPEHNNLEVGYDVRENIFSIRKRILQETERFSNEPFSIVAHSYGCLIAALIAEALPDQVENIIALSPPWGGSHTAKWLGRVFRDNSLFSNTTPNSELLSHLNSATYSTKLHNIITTGGSNVLAGLGSKPNDGMITVESQEKIPTGFENPENEYVQFSHGEVLLSFDVVNIIKRILFKETS